MVLSRWLLFDDSGVSLTNVYLTFTAVPDPSALVLVGVGLAGLALARRRARVR